MADLIKDIADQLSADISKDVGNMHEDDLESISSSFDKTLADALKVFNSSTFDDDGFIKKMRDIDLGGDKQGRDMVRNVLNNLKGDSVDVNSINQTELLLRRDLWNVCTQMPEMRDVVYVVRDAIIECNVSTGEVSRSIIFENHEDNDAYEAQAKEVELRHNLLMAIKNFIVPRTLMIGEMYIHVVPYAKLFAEIEAIHDFKYGANHNKGALASPFGHDFKESIPTGIYRNFSESKSIYDENNLKVIMESTGSATKQDSTDSYKIEKNGDSKAKNENSDFINKEHMKAIMENIHVCNGSSVLFEEMGGDGFRDFILDDYKRQQTKSNIDKGNYFIERLQQTGRAMLGQDIEEEDINYKAYDHIKGCYIKYLDGLRMIPVRMDRRVIGYYYATTTMDLNANPAQPNGIVDMSFHHYKRDKDLVDSMAGIIIKTFDKKMLEKNIKLKNEIAEILMAHRFSEGRLKFIFIPENEVVRIKINEDEDGKGHSVIEPTLFPARMYLMLTMYNMLFILNNNTTRIHYLRSSGLNKDYAAQIQRTMRKFQSRRITIDDIYSFQGAINKVGGMTEIVLPAGRGDYKALETDTIEPANAPMNIEFLEQQRRQAISGTGVPHLLIINAIDEVDFAKTLEMANTRYLSTVSSYKIDFNDGLTELYQLLMKYSTDLEDDIIQAFRFKFNAIKQQELSITADMVANFNSMVELVQSIYFPNKSDWEDKDGNATPTQMHLRRELAREYLPQLDFDNLEEIIKRVAVASKDDELQARVNTLLITPDEIDKNMGGKEDEE